MPTQRAAAASLTWLGIVRLGLVQTALGAIIVLPTSTFNRVMTVELGLAATLPAALVAWHYVVQLSRPRWGHGSDVGGARTPWILGGLFALAAGAVLAAVSVSAFGASMGVGMALSLVAYTLIGGGVASAGTSLLAFLASAVAPSRRPAAAAITWIMMIAGIVVTAIIAGGLLDPYSPQRLLAVTGGVAAVAVLVSAVALWGMETRHAAALTTPNDPRAAAESSISFVEVLRATLRDRVARAFTVFVFVSMLAYNMQDMILEPFAGLVFGYSLGQSTQLAGMQHGGVLLGMLVIGALGARLGGHDAKGLRVWMIGGCLGSALALGILAVAGVLRWDGALKPIVFALGFANGVFAVSAIGAMMALAGAGGGGRVGMRMGVWGAAQAMAFGAGGLIGAGAADGLRHLLASDAQAFGAVFLAESATFLISAFLALRIGGAALDSAARAPALPTEFAADALVKERAALPGGAQ